MNNKDFVPFKESLELKKLGFDEPCFGYRDGGGYLMIKSMSHCAISAPTFSQAFRWFREKYGYYISFFRTHDGNWGTDLWLLGVHKPKATVFGEIYEETELACLRKLIEIVKTQKTF